MVGLTAPGRWRRLPQRKVGWWKGGRSSAFFVRECKELTSEAILFVSGRVGREEKEGRVGGRVPAFGCPPPWWVS